VYAHGGVHERGRRMIHGVQPHVAIREGNGGGGPHAKAQGSGCEESPAMA
jgi:hypothetical protein